MEGVCTIAGFRSWLDHVVACEQAEGWLLACEGAGRYLAITRELLDPLASLLRSLARGSPIVEVCAGNGELAGALKDVGLTVMATDANPSTLQVERLSAEEALDKYRPRVVLGSFVPYDAGVEGAILRCPSVRHYVVLGARLGGAFGSGALGQNPDWYGALCTGITRWMITRHDVWLGEGPMPLLQHGEAWHYRRLPQ